MTDEQDLQEIEELQAMLREDSSNFQARRRLAVVLLDKGFNEESLKQFQFLISIFLILMLFMVKKYMKL